MSGVSNIDLSGALALVKMQQDLSHQSITFKIRNVNGNSFSVTSFPHYSSIFRLGFHVPQGSWKYESAVWINNVSPLPEEFLHHDYRRISTYPLLLFLWTSHVHYVYSFLSAFFSSIIHWLMLRSLVQLSATNEYCLFVIKIFLPSFTFLYTDTFVTFK